MLSSVGIQSASKIHPSNPLLTRNSPRNHISTFPKTLALSLTSPNKPKPKSIKISQTLEKSIPDDKKKRGVVEKTSERPRLVLKFVWMESDIGIALDQVLPGEHNRTIPLSPYYFWPTVNQEEDAWEELKVMLESKPWISETHRIILLNQASDIINLWQSTHVEL